jgi:hypothetical protein
MNAEQDVLAPSGWHPGWVTDACIELARQSLAKAVCFMPATACVRIAGLCCCHRRFCSSQQLAPNAPISACGARSAEQSAATAG